MGSKVISRQLGIEDAILAVFAESDLRESTRRTYQASSSDFVKWYLGTGQKDDTNLMVRYKRHLELRKNLAPRTKNLYLNAMRTVFRRLFEMGYMPSNLGKTVRSFSIPTTHKSSPISDEQITRVWEYLERKGDLRLTAILHLLLVQGLRQKELVCLDVRDLDFENLTLAVQSKGVDEKELTHLHPDTAAALKRYVAARDIRDGYVFYSKQNPEGHISLVQIHRIMKALHEELGIRATTHAWRKAFTSKLIESGMNLLDVQRFTRHKSTEMLKVYYDRIDATKQLPKYYSVFAELAGA
jgi:integrase/recombinase XerD